MRYSTLINMEAFMLCSKSQPLTFGTYGSSSKNQCILIKIIII